MVGLKGSSGKTNSYDKCPTLGDDCLIEKALKLHQKYLESIKKADDITNAQSERLGMALFVKEIADKAADPANATKEIKPKDVWHKFAPDPRLGIKESENYDQTCLKADIESMQQMKAVFEQEKETNAQNLIDFLKKADFQNHLVKVHKSRHLSSDENMGFYGIDTPQKVIREIDHVLAILTEYLSFSKNGLTFLEDLFDSSKLSALPAFKEVWDYLKTLDSIYADDDALNSALEAPSKFLYNVSAVVIKKLDVLGDGKDLIDKAKKRIEKVDDILHDPKIKTYIDFLDKHFPLKISVLIKERVGKMVTIGKTVLVDFKNGQKISDSLKKFQKPFDERVIDKLHEARQERARSIEKLSSHWFYASLDVLSFSITCVKLAIDYQDAELTDWLGAVNDLLGFVKGSAEAHQVSLISQGIKAEQVGFFIKVLGVVTGIITVIISICNLAKSFARKDWVLVGLDFISVGLAVGGLICALVSLSILSGVLAILGIAIAILINLVTDPPLLGFFKDSAWGCTNSGYIPVKETIKKYFETLFSLRIMYITDPNRDLCYLQIQCNVLSDTLPVYIQPFSENGKPFDQKLIKPSLASIDGKGDVVKAAGTWTASGLGLPRTIRVYRLHDIWPDAAVQKHVTIKVGLDFEMSGTDISKMTLNCDGKIHFY